MAISMAIRCGLITTVALTLSGCWWNREADLRAALDKLFPPQSLEERRIEAIKQAETGLAELQATIIAVADGKRAKPTRADFAGFLAKTDVDKIIAAAIRPVRTGDLKVEGIETLAIKDYQLDFGQQEIRLSLAFRFKPKDVDADVEGVLKGVVPVAIVKSELKLWPSLDSIEIISLKQGYLPILDVEGAVQQIAKAATGLRDNINGQIGDATVQIGLEKALHFDPAAALKNVDGVKLVAGEPIEASIALAGASLLIQPEGIHLLAKASLGRQEPGKTLAEMTALIQSDALARNTRDLMIESLLSRGDRIKIWPAFETIHQDPLDYVKRQKIRNWNLDLKRIDDDLTREFTQKKDWLQALNNPQRDILLQPKSEPGMLSGRRPGVPKLIPAEPGRPGSPNILDRPDFKPDVPRRGRYEPGSWYPGEFGAPDRTVNQHLHRTDNFGIPGATDSQNMTLQLEEAMRGLGWHGKAEAADDRRVAGKLEEALAALGRKAEAAADNTVSLELDELIEALGWKPETANNGQGARQIEEALKALGWDRKAVYLVRPIAFKPTGDYGRFKEAFDTARTAAGLALPGEKGSHLAVSTRFLAQAINSLVGTPTLRFDLDYHSSKQNSGWIEIKTPKAPALNCRQNARPCDFSANSCLDESNCKAAWNCPSCEWYQADCHVRRGACEFDKGRYQSMCNLAKGVRNDKCRAEVAGKKSACEIVKAGEIAGCEINQTWLNHMSETHVANVRAQDAELAVKGNLAILAIDAGESLSELKVRFSTMVAAKIATNFDVQPRNLGYAVCQADVAGTFATELGLTKVDEEIVAVLERLQEGEKARLQIKLKSPESKLQFAEPPLTTLLKHNPQLALKCMPVATATAFHQIYLKDILVDIPGLSDSAKFPSMEHVMSFDITARKLPVEITLQKGLEAIRGEVALRPVWSDKHIALSASLQIRED